MKFLILFFVFLLALTAYAQAGTPAAIFDIEKKIASQQGQFGGLYARCGSVDEKAVIGGSLAEWRSETFRGFHGTADEQAGLEKAFDDASNAIALNTNSCQDWIKTAAATWHEIVQLSQQGVPVATYSR